MLLKEKTNENNIYQGEKANNVEKFHEICLYTSSIISQNSVMILSIWTDRYLSKQCFFFCFFYPDQIMGPGVHRVF